jgi:hypothetical protein
MVKAACFRRKYAAFFFYEVFVDHPLLVRCANCGRNFETERFGRQTCPICGAEIDLDSPEGEPAAEAAPVGVPEPVPAVEAPADEAVLPHVRLEIVPPWEVPGANLVFRFFQTLKQILAAPSLFFYGLKVKNLGRALSFAWILFTLAVFFSMLYSLWSLERDPQALLQNIRIPADAGTTKEALLEAVRSRLLLGLYASPVLGLLNLLLSALLYHLGVWLLSRKNRGLVATFRATAYGCAPLLFSVVPFIGLLLGGLGTIALQILALSAVHRLSPLRTSVAVILPTMAVLLLITALF